MRVVIDTNVLISAIFWTGKPKAILNAVRKRKFAFVTSLSLLKELKGVLVDTGKPFRLVENNANQIVNSIKHFAEIVRVSGQVTVCEDEGDNRVLECAISGKVEYIVTGDKDLLDLKSFRGIKIIKVSDFLRILNKI